MTELARPEEDPRWIKLQSGATRCSSCGQTHQGVFDLAYAAPYYWEGDPNPIAAPRDVQDWNNFLTDDLCVINGEHYFVRCVLRLPVRGLEDQALGFGVWSSLSKQNFKRYLDDDPNTGDGEATPWFGWFSNLIEGYMGTLEIKCNVLPQDGGLRPLLRLEPTDHPLSIAQTDGLTLDQLFDIYDKHGHKF